MSEPAGSWSYSYDADSRLTSQENPASETTSWGFDADSRATSQTFANGQVDSYGFDTRSRQTSVTHRNSSGTTISAETYVLDNASNLTSKTVDSVTTSYGYNAANQLTSESCPSYSYSYTYDANGNRSSFTSGGTTQIYNVDNGDKLNTIVSGSTTLKSYTYDAAGRTTGVTTSAGTTTMSYDYEDRITQISLPGSVTDTFTYNGLDTRATKDDSTGNYNFVRDGADVTDPVLDDGAASYAPGVSRHTSSGTVFDNLNYIGTSTRQTNSSQTTTATRTYDAFGNLFASTGTPVGPFGFVGKGGYQEDHDSGLKLLGHRYYDPSTGRFLTRDSVHSGRNWYSYCNNNPTKQTDPNGHLALWLNLVVRIIAMLNYLYNTSPFKPIEPSEPITKPVYSQPVKAEEDLEPPRKRGRDDHRESREEKMEEAAEEGEEAAETVEVIEGAEVTLEVIVVVAE